MRIFDKFQDGYKGIEIALGEAVLQTEQRLDIAPDAEELANHGMSYEDYHDPAHAGYLPARIAVGGLASAIVISAAKIKGWL